MSHRLGTVDLLHFSDTLRAILDSDSEDLLIVAVTLLIEGSAHTCEHRQYILFAPRCAAILSTSKNVLLQDKLIQYLRLITKVDPRIGGKIESILFSLLKDSMKVVKFSIGHALTEIQPFMTETKEQCNNIVSEFISDQTTIYGIVPLSYLRD